MRTLIRIFVLVALVVTANAIADDTANPHNTTGGDPPQIGAFHGHPAPTGLKVDYEALFDAARPLKEAPEAQALIDAVMARYGGRPMLEKMNSLVMEYFPEGSSPSKPTITKCWRFGRYLKNTTTTGDQQSSRYLADQDSWMTHHGELQTGTTGRYLAELYSYLVLAMPLAIEKESFNDIRFGRRNDDSLQYLYLKKPDSLMIVLGIDGKDHLIRSSEGIVYDQGGTAVFKNVFSDFREIEGHVFPHRIENTSMGMNLGAIILNNVEFNPSLPEALFRPKKPIEVPPSH